MTVGKDFVDSTKHVLKPEKKKPQPLLNLLSIAWRQTAQKGLSNFEETLAQQHKEKRMRRKAAGRPASDFVCVLCHRDCHIRIGLVSHTDVVPE